MKYNVIGLNYVDVPIKILKESIAPVIGVWYLLAFDCSSFKLFRFIANRSNYPYHITVELQTSKRIVCVYCFEEKTKTKNKKKEVILSRIYQNIVY